MADEKKYTDKQLIFLEALLSEECKGNLRKAMNLAGYSMTTSITEVVSSLKDEINDRASMMLAMNAPKAAWGMVDVLDDPGAMGARNSIAAAAQILDRTGLIKKDQIEVKNTGGVMFILPPKNED
jgi:hypothetical protein|tara:strand:- start:1574 stop:1948 length:375 start_codon:yes stop_codon:yes gene_type:complete